MARGPLASGERRIATNEWSVSAARWTQSYPRTGGVLNAVALKYCGFPSAQPFVEGVKRVSERLSNEHNPPDGDAPCGSM